MPYLKSSSPFLHLHQPPAIDRSSSCRNPAAHAHRHHPSSVLPYAFMADHDAEMRTQEQTSRGAGINLLSDKRLLKKMNGDERIEWLRRQVIGAGAEAATPFGRRTVTYADHTASGRALYCIEDFIVRNTLPFYGNTHTEDSFVGRKTTRMVKEASRYIKRCMGAGADDHLIFCGSGATAAVKRLQEAMGLAVSPIVRDRVVAALRQVERWVVFVGPYEHHSNLLSWRQSTAEVVEIGAAADGMIDAAELELELSKHAGRPLLGSFSACSNVTGVVTDTRALARQLHRHGAFAVFDFAASAPYVEMDMRSGDMEGYDAVFVSTHKFAGGPGTPGILLMNKELYRLDSLPPTTCGGGTVSYVNGLNEQDTLYVGGVEEREDTGTPAIVQKVRAALAFWVKEFVGCRIIEQREDSLVGKFIEHLAGNPKIWVLGNNNNTRRRRLPIFSFLVFPQASEEEPRKGKPLHCRFVAKLLDDLFGIQSRGGCSCAGPYGHRLLGIGETLSLKIRSGIQKGYEGLKPGWTRVSFAYYTSPEEVEFVLDAVEFVAEHGRRFLPLYDLDFATGGWSFRRGGALKSRAMAAELVGDKKPAAESGGGRRFARYLEAARRIAGDLPEETMSTRSAPEDIDPDLVLFCT